jgi:hypothetical protein
MREKNQSQNSRAHALAPTIGFPVVYIQLTPDQITLWHENLLVNTRFLMAYPQRVSRGKESCPEGQLVLVVRALIDNFCLFRLQISSNLWIPAQAR